MAKQQKGEETKIVKRRKRKITRVERRGKPGILNVKIASARLIRGRLHVWYKPVSGRGRIHSTYTI